jgi:Signal recognition particle 9 kDa protein (SRP9)
MPYLDDWAEFQAQSEALFRSRPLHTRYVLKYRHCEGRLVLKVTDDIVVSSLSWHPGLRVHTHGVTCNVLLCAANAPTA